MHHTLYISPALPPISERFQQGSRTLPVFRGVHFRLTCRWPQRLKPRDSLFRITQSIQDTLCIAHYTLYMIHFTYYDIHDALFTIHSMFYIVHRSLYNHNYALYIFDLYIIHCTLSLICTYLTHTCICTAPTVHRSLVYIYIYIYIYT